MDGDHCSDLRAYVGEHCQVGLKTDGELVDYIHMPFNQDHWRAFENP
jgi:hypothetical protein